MAQSKLSPIKPRKAKPLVKMTSVDKGKSSHSLSGHKRKDMSGRTYTGNASGY